MMLVLGWCIHKSGSAGVLNVCFATQLLRGRQNDAMRQNRAAANAGLFDHLVGTGERSADGASAGFKV
jgi:hypothetical protein